MKKSDRFSNVQIALHWGVFLLVIVTYATIELRGLAPRGSLARQIVIGAHFSCGFAILLLMVARLIYKFTHPAPAIVPPPALWQRYLANLSHFLIYALFLVLPVLGLLSRYLRGNDWAIFGIGMPVASPANVELARSLIDLHETLAPLGYWLIGLHAAAALFHHYFLRDNTLLRMMPAKKDRSAT
ncbi:MULTISPECIES: cytochrome b561 [unclassified Brenneria]|uniref:cytochrome b561 n=1 Tax=unclassified Brenneria TaxID=2634434 RepID=UPI001553AED7|nr:cytochrome b561 [Brenneria sp. hezel4-2-4]MEE3652947.1 cytochrome b561 [Brenneria sp. HEZEL_4_2_4]NPD02901.1 cytochrome b561 [Brenneria sp. hezel4-2-4]